MQSEGEEQPGAADEGGGVSVGSVLGTPERYALIWWGENSWEDGWTELGRPSEAGNGEFSPPGGIRLGAVGWWLLPALSDPFFPSCRRLHVQHPDPDALRRGEPDCA